MVSKVIYRNLPDWWHIDGDLPGFVVSDWGATHDSATDNANAGLDMEQPGDWILIGGGVYNPGLQSAVNEGSVTEEASSPFQASTFRSYSL